MYWADLICDTMHLSRGDFGSYMLLLARYYHQERGPLPDDDEALRTTARCDSSDWPRLKALLAKMFHMEQGYWRHSRADKEIAEASAAKEAARLRNAPGLAAMNGRSRNAVQHTKNGHSDRDGPKNKSVTGPVTDTVRDTTSEVRSQKSVPEHCLISPVNNSDFPEGGLSPPSEMSMKCADANPVMGNPATVGDLMGRCLMLMGKSNMAQSGGHFTILARQNPGKFERVLCEVEQKAREGFQFTNIGGYFTDLWQRFQ